MFTLERRSLPSHIGFIVFLGVAIAFLRIPARLTVIDAELGTVTLTRRQLFFRRAQSFPLASLAEMVRVTETHGSGDHFRIELVTDEGVIDATDYLSGLLGYREVEQFLRKHGVNVRNAMDGEPRPAMPAIRQ